MEPKDKKGDKESIYDIAKRSGYTVCFTQKDASALKEGDKAIVIAETLALTLAHSPMKRTARRMNGPFPTT